MTFESTWNPHSPVAQQRRESALARLAQWHELQDRAALASAQSKPVFDKRGQLLPRERVALLLDPGAPFLSLCALAPSIGLAGPGGSCQMPAGSVFQRVDMPCPAILPSLPTNTTPPSASGELCVMILPSA